MKTALPFLLLSLLPDRARADALPWDGADIVQVVLSDFFQSTVDASQTATINMSFQFFQTPQPFPGAPPDRYGIIPGTLVIDAQGFLPGTFTSFPSTTSDGYVNWGQGYMPFNDVPGPVFDQFEIYGPQPGGNFFVPGLDNLTDLYVCGTAQCKAGLGAPPYYFVPPTSHTMTVTRVPEPDGILTLLVDLIGLALLAQLIRRWGRVIPL